jgi:hypothetical protein
MARVSHFVELKNFGRAASPRLREPLHVGQVQSGWHDDKMEIDLSGGIISEKIFRQNAKIANFCSSSVGPFLAMQSRYMPPLVTINHNAPLRHFACGPPAAGKPNMSVVCAVMRKPLQIVFGVLTHQQPFNPSLA